MLTECTCSFTRKRRAGELLLLSFHLRSWLQGLQAIRCPAGLYFDIEKQTCDWKAAVKNCKLKNKERKVKPLLFTDEPLCQVYYIGLMIIITVLFSLFLFFPLYKRGV